MGLRLHAKFLDALAALSQSDQKRVRTALQQLAEGDLTPGLRPHPVGNFMSFSPSMELRILAVSEPNGWVLVHVDHHDNAYTWGERHSAVLGSDDLLLAILPTTSPIRAPMARSKDATQSPRFAGLPNAVADILNAAATDDELIETISALSPEWQEIALALAIEPVRTDAPSDIVAVDDELLQFALSLPAEKWRVFLHPTQRAVVDLPASGNLLLRGGPGTGKTVCLVHRFVRLSAIYGDRPPILIALNAPAREAIELACRSLGHDPRPGTVIDFADLDRRASLKELVGRTSAVLIDEGQDLPVGVIARLLGDFERGEPLPALTIAFDPNQAIIEPSGDALARLQPFFDSVTLTYCYRMTSEILGYSSAVLHRLHTGLTGKRFQDQHRIDARRDLVSARMTTMVTGPEVWEESVEVAQLVDRAVEKAEELHAFACTWDGLGVVVVGDEGDMIAILRALGIPAFNASDVKGLEFFRGLVVDCLPDVFLDGGPTSTTAAGYREQSGLYVALTRFRDQVSLLTTHSKRLVRRGS